MGASPTHKNADNSMKSSAEVIEAPIIPQENEIVKKPPALIDFIDAVASNNWKDIDLMKVAGIALRNYLGEMPGEHNSIEDFLDVSFVQEFSSIKQFWFAKVTVGKKTWDASIPSAQYSPFSCGLGGLRLGRIVYDSQESAVYALLFFILRSVDPTGQWTHEFLAENERSCLLKKANSNRSVLWTALMRKGDRVYLADMLEDKKETPILKKLMSVGRST